MSNRFRQALVPTWIRRGRRGASASALEFQELLSLDHLRARLGRDWDDKGPAIFRAAHRLIERHKNGPIAVERHGTCFRLTFRCASRADALQRTLDIATALDRAILAQFSPDPRMIRGRAHSRPGLVAQFKRFLDWLGGIDAVPQPIPGSRTEAVASAAPGSMHSPRPLASVPATPLTAHPVPSLAAPVPAPLAVAVVEAGVAPVAAAPANPTTVATLSAAGVAHSPAIALGQAAAVATVVAATTVDAELPADVDDDVSGIEALLEREEARLASEQRTLAVAAEFPPANLQFVLRPIWSIKTNLLGLSTCLPAHIRSGTELCVGYDVLPAGYDQEMTSFLDELVLRQVIEECRACEQAGRAPLIVIPVHYDNLSDPDRLQRYRELCQELPRAARKYLGFELWGIGDAYGHHQVAAILATLRTYSSMRFGMLSPRQSSLSFWKNAGLHGVGLDVAHLARQCDREKVLIETIDRFRLCAYRAGLRAYARGVPTRSIALACVAAGYDFIDGPVIQRGTDHTSVSRFSLPDLYGVAAA